MKENLSLVELVIVFNLSQSHTAACSQLPWDGGENQKRKSDEVVGWDKGTLIGKAKAVRASRAK